MCEAAFLRWAVLMHYILWSPYPSKSALKVCTEKALWCGVGQKEM